ncbi:MAG: hypothetical protein U5O15_08805 [Candidatus Krumholzibacteriota bacterium]|nr:hypothetical protein [Candidatus Krumholzibacteriota bacterium]
MVFPFPSKEMGKSESESGNCDFLAGKIDSDFDNANSRIYKLYVIIGETPKITDMDITQTDIVRLPHVYDDPMI